MQAQQRLNRIQVARQRGTEGAAKRLLLLLLTGVWRALIAHRHSALGAEAAEKLLGAILGGEGPPLPTTSSEEETGGATAEGGHALSDPGQYEGGLPVGGRGTHPLGGKGLPKEEDGGTVQRHCGDGGGHCIYCADRQGHELEREALRDRVSELEQELSCSQVCVGGGREGQVCTKLWPTPSNYDSSCHGDQDGMMP